MRHYVQLIISTLFLLVVAKAVEEPAPTGAVPPASQCTVSLLQTDLRLLGEEAAAHSPAKSMAESEGKPLPYRHVAGTVRSTVIQALKDVGEGHKKEQAGDTASAQVLEKENSATKSFNTEHLVELKASSEFAKQSRLQQATSKEQSKTIDVRLNSELQTQLHMKDRNTAPNAHNTAPAQLAENDEKADNTAPKAHSTAPAQLAEKDEEATSLKASSDTERLVELKASSEYAEKSRSEAYSKKETKVGTINVRLSSELQLQSIAKDSHVATQTANVQAQSSSTAKTVVLLRNMVQDSSGGLLMMLFVGMLVCVCMTLMLMGTKMQDPNDKDFNCRPPPPGTFASGHNARRTPLNSAMAVPGASAARLMARATPQQSLRTLPVQQRTPLGSSAVLQPRAKQQMEKLESSSSGSGELPEPGNRNDLPPICASLILPHTEARFMIPMDHMKRSWVGPLKILGTSGRKLLHALVCDTPDNRRCLVLASCGCEDDPRTCIFTPAGTTDPQAALEVFGRSGKFYGWLEFPAGKNQALLMHSGEDGETNRVLKIDMGNVTDLQISASTMDGKVLASAGRSAPGHHLQSPASSADGKDTWKMQVKPGTDAVLITSCMLALIVLKPLPAEDGWMSLPKGSTFTPQGTATSLRSQVHGRP